MLNSGKLLVMNLRLRVAHTQRTAVQQVVHIDPYVGQTRGKVKGCCVDIEQSEGDGYIL